MTSPSDPAISRILDRFSAACSLLAIAFGVWVLTGWMFHLRIVKSILPGQVTVMPNTAVCFVLIGLALWVLRKERLPAAAGLDGVRPVSRYRCQRCRPALLAGMSRRLGPRHRSTAARRRTRGSGG